MLYPYQTLWKYNEYEFGQKVQTTLVKNPVVWVVGLSKQLKINFILKSVYFRRFCVFEILVRLADCYTSIRLHIYADSYSHADRVAPWSLE